MKVLLNSKELEGVVPQNATLGMALASVQEAGIDDENVISAIWVDDEPLTAERLSIWKDRPATDFTEARIEAPTRKSLVYRGLTMIAQGLRESTTQREQIVDDVCQGQTSQAMDKLVDYLRIWNAVQQTMLSVGRLMGVDLTTTENSGHMAGIPDAELVSQRIGQLTEQLSELKTALENSDLVLVGDILDYEFGDMTSNWCELLDQLADHFQE
ncbi:MAG: hypothetical protein JW936_02545 [Sedimentisphaerales bacterium]|nr:hypothetical protein [Sedimentisphaerales bacterium]